MRALLVAMVLVVGCTKRNPNVCCVDETDCNANGIPNGSTCADGLLCRGNQCIAETCTMADQCDSAAPYCVGGSCSATCSGDPDCPGLAQAAEARYCEGGACVACRMGMPDCPATAPVCDLGTCRTCRNDDECPSTACDLDSGACIDPASIRYAAPTGLDANSCSQSAPCTLTKALAITDSAHPYARMLPGTYGASSTISIVNPALKIIATGATLRQDGTQARMFDIGTNATVAVRGLAMVVVTATGYNVTPSSGTANLDLVEVSGGDINAISTGSASVHVELARSDVALSVGNNTTTIVDQSRLRNLVVQTTSSTTTLSLAISNSVIAGTVEPVFNASTTPNAFSVYFAYNTIYTDATYGAPALYCPHISGGTAPATTGIYTNNIIYAPSVTNALIMDTTCTVNNNVVYPQQSGSAGSNAIIQDPKFVDFPNVDLHLMSGSPAIDSAMPILNDPTVDLDGTTRPQGPRRDIGAFEYH